MSNQQKDTSRSDTTADASLTGGDASSGDIPPPANKGGASAA